MKIILFIVSLFIQSLAFSHDYYFAFAEMEYNRFTQKFEVTLVVSGHDLDYVWRDSGLSTDRLSQLDQDSEEFEKVQSYIFDGFSIIQQNQAIQFKLIGIEALLNGVVHFYLESEPTPLSNELEIEFDLLMDEFPQQQNKLTFFLDDRTLTKAFLQEDSTHLLIIETR